MTMLNITLIKFCFLIFKKNELFMNHLMLVFFNKMKRLKGKKAIFLQLLVPFYSKKKKISKHYWTKVVLTTAHLINILPSQVLGFKSPMQEFLFFFLNFILHIVLLLESLVVSSLLTMMLTWEN